MSAPVIQIDFTASVRSFTEMILGDDNIADFLPALTTFHKNSRLWLKAHAYFEKKGPDATYNVIARAYDNVPDDQEVAEIFALESIKKGLRLKENGRATEANAFFEDAERVYYDLTHAFDWPTITPMLGNLYTAWGREQEAEYASGAFAEPPDVNGIRFLVDQRNLLDVQMTRNHVSKRNKGLAGLDSFIPRG